MRAGLIRLSRLSRARRRARWCKRQHDEKDSTCYSCAKAARRSPETEGGGERRRVRGQCQSRLRMLVARAPCPPQPVARERRPAGMGPRFGWTDGEVKRCGLCRRRGRRLLPLRMKCRRRPTSSQSGRHFSASGGMGEILRPLGLEPNCHFCQAQNSSCLFALEPNTAAVPCATRP